MKKKYSGSGHNKEEKKNPRTESVRNLSLAVQTVCSVRKFEGYRFRALITKKPCGYFTGIGDPQVENRDEPWTWPIGRRADKTMDPVHRAGHRGMKLPVSFYVHRRRLIFIFTNTRGADLLRGLFDRTR